jgi:hypothetical protein
LKALDGLHVWSVPEKTHTVDAGNLNFAAMVDKADWTTAARIGDSFGPSWSTHWFKVEFTIPKAWTLSLSGDNTFAVHFVWDSGCEAALYDAHGRLIQGLTGGDGHDKRHAVPLHDAKAGEPTVVFIEMACNGMFGNGNGMIAPPVSDRTFALKTCAVRLFNRAYWGLYWDFQVCVVGCGLSLCVYAVQRSCV